MSDCKFFLFALVFVAFQLNSSAQSKALFTDVYWEIPMHARHLLSDSNIVYCVRVKGKDSIAPKTILNGFIFYSDGRFQELKRRSCSRDRNTYSGKWVQRGDTIEVNINEQLYWFFKFETLSINHFRAQYWIKWKKKND